MARRHIGVRDEYAPTFGRQNLTLWSPPFASVFEGWAHELPGHDGFMVQMQYGPKFKVTCPSPRDGENYDAVDDAIRAGIKDATKVECRSCGNDIWESWSTPHSLMGWAEDNWKDDRDFQCGIDPSGRHQPPGAMVCDGCDLDPWRAPVHYGTCPLATTKTA